MTSVQDAVVIIVLMSYGLLMRMQSWRGSSWSSLWTRQVSRKCSVVSGVRQRAQSALSRSRIFCRPAFVLLCPRRMRVIVVSFRQYSTSYFLPRCDTLEWVETNGCHYSTSYFLPRCETFSQILYELVVEDLEN